MKKNNNQIRNLTVSFIVAFILPVIAYGILKWLHYSDTMALGVATAFPVLLTIYSAIRKRKINPIGLVAVCGFLISILAVYLTNGNDMAFKLWHPILTGAIGIVLLFSAAINHPIMGILSRNKVKAALEEEVYDTEEDKAADLAEMHRFFMIYTLFMGIVFALHATLTIMLALAVGTTQFVLLSKGIDIGSIIILAGGIYLINRRLSEDEIQDTEKNDDHSI
ncbi:VC0807 family protein [Lactococcus fujiensis]|uniref:Integral membrane protein n=1 Tax=Lactococcus fujiensis JCM 16395 TaxID=1291764 RepID=A0A2A5RQ08_9LACT|nr:VC0807 family protein [Lactococcus fujiensis]PCS01512.1 hypothetical protein RT41_GL000276 [Lactococcus fujiensis JCM 16395]